MATNMPSYQVTQPGRSSTPLAERLNALNDKANAPMVCPDCGSVFFYKVSAEQFSNAGYGTASFRSLSTSTESVYICLCGRVSDINDSAVGARSSIDRHAQFIGALKAAIGKQKKNSLQTVAEQCASIEEVSNLEARVKWLEDAIDVLVNKDESSQTEDESLKTENSEPEIEQVSKPGRRKKEK